MSLQMALALQWLNESEQITIITGGLFPSRASDEPIGCETDATPIKIPRLQFLHQIPAAVRTFSYRFSFLSLGLQ
jgi:hypothetical protein